MLFDLTSYQDLALLILRLSIAAIFLYHALPKLTKTKDMAQGVGMPAGMVFMLGGIELLSAIAVVLGFYLQLGALLLAIVMIGAIFFKIVKWQVPFAAMDKTGWEFDLILLAANLVLLVGGGGAIALQ